ncbi:MAG: TetR/AcrR family transcriptional regulator [Tissierellales bacterium]|jgi:AcrR family transcriptional regulator|nr:TetR/AcrR family transcriptional regulator [Tissierellales bacterium]HCX02974.1 hypothetical protein [Clostridiales bacterium]
MRKGQSHPSSNISKNMLAQGLMELLEEKEYKAITITQLCEQAKIARRTFYRHFESKEDILSYYISCIINEFQEELQICENKDFETIIITYFSFWEKHTRLLLLLNKYNLTHIIFTQYIKCFYQHPIILRPNNQVLLDDNYFACNLAYTSGGLWSVLMYWISNGFKQTPKELAAIICDI